MLNLSWAAQVRQKKCVCRIINQISLSIQFACENCSILRILIYMELWKRCSTAFSSVIFVDIFISYRCLFLYNQFHSGQMLIHKTVGIQKCFHFYYTVHKQT